MYGRVFESMYEGSMVGAGPHVFAVWNYIVAKNRKGIIEINPPLLGFILGCETAVIEDALKKLQSEDPASRSDAEGGRRLIKEGQFQYRMVNWLKYDEIRQEIDRREYNRTAQAKFREKHQQKTTVKESITVNDSQSRSKFQRPTIPELIAEGLDEKQANKFLNYHESKGWRIGKSPMKDWRAAVRTWKSNAEEWGDESNGNHSTPKRLSKMTKEEERQLLQEAIQ